MHIAIIMDGNGRWAQSRGMSRISGHREGARRVEDIVKHASDLGVTTLTLYAFSTENWQRPSREVKTIFQLIKLYLRQKVQTLIVENVQINFIGRRDKLPKSVVVEMDKSESATKACTGLKLNIAVDYGGRNEIIRAMNAFIQEKGSYNKEISEADLSDYSDLKNQPDPDLIIRTGGDRRLSNFMLWHAAYSELDFIDTLWPNFLPSEFDAALTRFNNTKRRYGAIQEVAE